MANIFPPIDNANVSEKNPQTQIYGHRLFKDQTLYEYLLEFLLLFSAKKGGSNYIETDEGFSFFIPTNGENLYYYPSPKVGLKRFVFFNHSDQEKRFEVDKEALVAHRDHIRRLFEISNNSYNNEFVLNVLQDLFYGFNAITGKRSWFAQSLIPLSPEMIFCEAIGNKNDRTKLYDELKGLNDFTNVKVDKKFNFDQHAFMARGGEVYYLHVAQGLQLMDTSVTESLVSGLKNMITSVPQLSELAIFIQKNWEDVVDTSEEPNDEITNFHHVRKKVEFIPSAYDKRASYTVKELNNLIHCELDSFEKIELTGTLIALQIIRMMSMRATEVLNKGDSQEWLIDLTKNPKGAIRKFAVESYEQLEDNIYRAVHQADIEEYLNKNVKMNEVKALEAAAKDTNLLVRKIAKSTGFLIPSTGANMRFSLNENLVKVLVLSLVEPGERILFSTFLSKCYEHFKIIIGLKEAAIHSANTNKELKHLEDFDENEKVFLQLLKDCGFLRNLSDATSIVENPFKG